MMWRARFSHLRIGACCEKMRPYIHAAGENIFILKSSTVHPYPYLNNTTHRLSLLHSLRRIKRCRAGRFNWAVGILALVFVAAFVAGLFFKWFWQSFLFDNPLYLIIIVIIELMLGFSANYMEKRETAALIFDIENTIFEEWYEDPNAVRISIQKVYGTFPTTFRGHQTGSSKRRCCTGSPNTRQGTFISITFQREDDSESITGISRTMDTYTHRSDQLHAWNNICLQQPTLLLLEEWRERVAVVAVAPSPSINRFYIHVFRA